MLKQPLHSGGKNSIKKSILILGLLVILSVLFVSLTFVLRLGGLNGNLVDRTIISSSLPVEILWQIELEYSVTTVPIIVGDVVVPTSQSIYGIDVITGQLRWVHSMDRQSTPIPIAVSADKVIYGDENRQLTVLDVTTGALIWQHTIGFPADIRVTSTPRRK